jgi:hypothetical protein
VGISDFELDTNTDLAAAPHAPRKLHSVALTVYVRSGRKISFEMVVGGLIV